MNKTIPYIQQDEAFGNLQQSPFIYRNGMSLVLTNKKRFCTMKELWKLIEKGLVNESDIQLMRILSEYAFLTRYTLTQLINKDDTITGVHKKSNYKNCLSKLVGQGLLLRYQCIYTDDIKENHGPCFYGLSMTAQDYIVKIYGRFMPSKNPDQAYPSFLSPEGMLRTVVFNQAHLNFTANHARHILFSMKGITIKVNKKLYEIEGVYHIKYGQGRSDLDLVICPVRSDLNYARCIIRKIQATEEYVKTPDSLFHAPAYVLVCENSDHARTIHAEIERRDGFSDIPVFYILDRSLLLGDMMESLFKIVNTENGCQLIIQKLYFV